MPILVKYGIVDDSDLLHLKACFFPLNLANNLIFTFAPWKKLDSKAVSVFQESAKKTKTFLYEHV